MKHAYLTKKEIDKAKDMKQITKKEAVELRDNLDYCSIDRKKTRKNK